MIDPTTLRNTAVQPGTLETREPHVNPRACQQCGAPLVVTTEYQRVVNPDTPQQIVERVCRACFEADP